MNHWKPPPQCCSELANCRNKLPSPTTLSPTEMPFRICVWPFWLSPRSTSRLPNWFAPVADVDKRLVIVIAQYGCVWHGNGIGEHAGCHGDRAIHISFQLLARIIHHDARLQRSGVWIERRRDIGDPAMKAAGIRVCLHYDIISAMNISKVRLVYVCKHPHRAQI